ncbi:hypothetical protein RSOLAG22IIIB_05648 [Rhizoctonia solani]|uniref:C2H2-type domain-containing protein n=1 Tax=Rhizoctonia solani TaxID=456999 RepID=A0A0K6G836_9AGAM|nr:hypothetical protein RSOLAG22IIIB_05648 [Rhizoctonia solani]
MSTPSVNNLAQRLERLKVDHLKTDGDASSETDSNPSDDSHSNDGSTGNSSLEKGELPCPQSPISKGGEYEVSWELVQILTHERSFFLDYDGRDQELGMYCWAMVHNFESQIWRVNVIHDRFRFQLHDRVLHSSFTNDTAFITGYQLVLPSQRTNRVLFKLPAFTRITLYDDIMAAYQRLQGTNDIHYTTLMRYNVSFPSPPTTTPIIDANSMLLQSIPEHDPFSMQSDPRMNQGHPASGLVVTEGAQFIPGQYHHDQAPVTFGSTTPVGGGNMASNEVEMLMDVGDTTPTTDEVRNFTTTFRRDGPGKGAQVIVCLHCLPGSDRRRITSDLRPWNLTRHLLIDFGIKDFQCDECSPPRDFTFKDQLERHVAKRHCIRPKSGDGAACPSGSQ